MKQLNKKELKNISGGSEIVSLLFLMIIMNFLNDDHKKGGHHYNGEEPNRGRGRRRQRRNGNGIFNMVDIYNKNINKIELGIID